MPPVRWYANKIVILATGCFLNSWAEPLVAQTTSIYDKIWDIPVLYQNENNPTIQSFSLVGRYHGQYWNVNADQGNAQDWENRREIIGFSSKWFSDFKLEAQMYLNTSNGPIYDGLYVAFISWTPADTDFSLDVGRLDYLFTGFERSKSSKKINAIERGLLVNQIMPAEVVGVHLQGKQGRFSYHAGLFSSSLEEEFSDFDTGSAGVIGAAYDAPLFFEEGQLHLDYLHSSRDSQGNAFKPYRHVASLWHRGESGRLGMGIDLTVAVPLETEGHVWGLTLEPTWMLRDSVFAKDDALQLVARYQYATGNKDNSLQLQRRYEQEVSLGEGNKYQAFYGGVNYFLYGHKLKFMFGGEYAHMQDDADDVGRYRGWTWFGAVRLYF
jgi:phosphate-selective porin OprO/OprP